MRKRSVLDVSLIIDPRKTMARAAMDLCDSRAQLRDRPRQLLIPAYHSDNWA